MDIGRLSSPLSQEVNGITLLLFEIHFFFTYNEKQQEEKVIINDGLELFYQHLQFERFHLLKRCPVLHFHHRPHSISEMTVSNVTFPSFKTSEEDLAAFF